MSEFDLSVAVEEFCSHAIFVGEDGQSKLHDLLSNTQKTISNIVLDLLESRKYILLSNFLKKVQRYPAECAIFLESEELNGLCAAIAAIDKHEELKLNFTQLFLRDTPSDGRSLYGIISPAIRWIAADSLELSDTCSQVLAMLAAKNISIADDVVTQIMQQLDTVKDDSTKYLRYLCLLSNFMKISSDYFVLCEAKGAAAVVISSCQTPDILLQTISLDFLVELSASPAGATHLFQNQQVHWLVAMGGGEGGAAYLSHAEGHAVEPFLIPQAISCAAKVLRNLEKQAPHLLYDYLASCSDPQQATVLTQPSASCSPLMPVFVSGLLDLLEHSQETERLAGLEAIATYGTSSPRAFLALLSSDRLLTVWLGLLRKQPSVQASTLHTVGQVLLYPALLGPDTPPAAPHERAVHILPAFDTLTAIQRNSVLIEMDTLKRKLFGLICVQLGTARYESTMEFLVKLAKGPIGELKHAAYDVLRALAYQTQTWGVHTLFEYTGFYPFLLDRSTEHDKQGKDWKFSLVLGLHYSPHLERLVEAIPERVQALVQQGAYYVPMEMAAPATMEL